MVIEQCLFSQDERHVVQEHLEGVAENIGRLLRLLRTSTSCCRVYSLLEMLTWLLSCNKNKKIDGSRRKPTHAHDTDYMVDKTYHLAPYFGPLEAYWMPYWPLQHLKGVPIYQKVVAHPWYLQSGPKTISWAGVKNIHSFLSMCHNLLVKVAKGEQINKYCPKIPQKSKNWVQWIW